MIPEPGIKAPRIKEPEPNAITRPYRGLSVQETDIPLTPAAIGDLLSRREIYRRPGPLPILVTEVIPPHPPKLLAMAEQVVGYDEDLPPVSLTLDAVDVRELVAANPAPHYLLPCRGGGLPAGPDVSFLDCHPSY